MPVGKCYLQACWCASRRSQLQYLWHYLRTYPWYWYRQDATSGEVDVLTIPPPGRHGTLPHPAKQLSSRESDAAGLCFNSFNARLPYALTIEGPERIFTPDLSSATLRGVPQLKAKQGVGSHVHHVIGSLAFSQNVSELKTFVNCGHFKACENRHRMRPGGMFCIGMFSRGRLGGGEARPDLVAERAPAHPILLLASVANRGHRRSAWCHSSVW